ncbi:MAG: hypothetical protein GX637_04320 [Clostridiales bacterium]|nr:hypothetical protein [Clostridiales bacterium]
MKRLYRMLCLILCLMFALSLPASAEIVGRTQDEYIHRLSAPNGQEVYFTSTMEEPFIEYQDVNFDGEEDLAVVTALGASNAYYEFFVMTEGQYVPADHPYALINYTLDDRGYVLSWGSNGMAGALFEAHLYRWDGTEMIPVRTLVSREVEETDWQEDHYTVTTYLDRFHVTLTEAEYEEGVLLDESVLWETEFADDDDAPDAFDEIHARLWQGL